MVSHLRWFLVQRHDSHHHWYFLHYIFLRIPSNVEWNGRFNEFVYFILGVVALFTLPKVYETNQEQIDQNLALVQAKINEITAK